MNIVEKAKVIAEWLGIPFERLSPMDIDASASMYDTLESVHPSRFYKPTIDKSELPAGESHD